MYSNCLYTLRNISFSSLPLPSFCVQLRMWALVWRQRWPWFRTQSTDIYHKWCVFSLFDARGDISNIRECSDTHTPNLIHTRIGFNSEMAPLFNNWSPIAVISVYFRSSHLIEVEMVVRSFWASKCAFDSNGDIHLILGNISLVSYLYI